MPITIALIALLGSTLLGLSAGAAVLLGAILAPTDPVLAGDIGVGPPGDEDEHEPNFALTSEAGLNDGLAFPFVLLGIAIAAEGGQRLDRRVGVRRRRSTRSPAAWPSARRSASSPPGASSGSATTTSSPPRSTSTTRWPPCSSSTASPRPPGRTASSPRSPAASPSAATRRTTTSTGACTRARSSRRSSSSSRSSSCSGRCSRCTGLGAPGWEGWLVAALVLVAVRPVSCVAALWGSQLDGPQDKSFVAWFGVRGVGSLFYLAVVVQAGVLSPTGSRTSSCGR